MDNHQRDSRTIEDPPSPPFATFISALGIAVLIFLCVYVFSAIVSLVIVVVLYISIVCFFRFVYDNRELDIEMEERNNHAQTHQNNQRVVGILDRLMWVVEERGRQRKLVLEKKLLDSVVCFGSHGASSSCSDCTICLEKFQKGEECLVFPVCRHVFHSQCINNWLENKLTCPVCRQFILSPTPKFAG